MQLLMRRPEIRGWVSIAPPAHTEDFTFLAPCPTSGLIVHGDNDTIVPRDDVQALVDTLRAQKGIDVDFEQIAECNHFFKGNMANLVHAVNDYLNKAHAGRTTDITKLLQAA
jgi:alpha/beta superfamily hydrolase